MAQINRKYVGPAATKVPTVAASSGTVRSKKTLPTTSTTTSPTSKTSPTTTYADSAKKKPTQRGTLSTTTTTQKSKEKEEDGKIESDNRRKQLSKISFPFMQVRTEVTVFGALFSCGGQRR